MLVSAASLALAACQPTIGDAPGIGSGVPLSDAAPGNGGDPSTVDGGSIEPRPDGGPGGPRDVTLSQTTSDQILDLHSRACVEQDDEDQPVQNRENSYYRVFDLPAAGIDGDFEVSSVTFGIESASTLDDSSQPATVRIHTLEGDLLVSGLSQVASKDIQITPQGQTTLEVPISTAVAAGSTVVAELFIPNSTEGRLFFIGSNNLGETEPGYLRAPASGCDFIEPTEFDNVGGAGSEIHIVLQISGTEL